jgi:hypothetical protein
LLIGEMRRLILKPEAVDVLEERPLILGLATNPDQSGKARHSILAKSKIEDGNPHIPVFVNKKATLWSCGSARGYEDRDISGTRTALKITEVDNLTIGQPTGIEAGRMRLQL